jgi:hypothetical protein
MQLVDLAMVAKSSTGGEAGLALAPSGGHAPVRTRGHGARGHSSLTLAPN